MVEEVRGHWRIQPPRDRDGPITRVRAVGRRSEEEVRRRPEVVLLLMTDEEQDGAEEPLR